MYKEGLIMFQLAYWTSIAGTNTQVDEAKQYRNGCSMVSESVTRGKPVETCTRKESTLSYWHLYT
jgi:hypothetical protein